MWNQHIDEILRKMGFVRLSSDHGVYVKWDGVNRVWLALYVDDVFLTGKVLAKIAEAKRVLGLDMKVKDLGSARYLLGIELRRRHDLGIWERGISCWCKRSMCATCSCDMTWWAISQPAPPWSPM